jgi:DNA-binding transcriptional regulator YdaS (Cro superfamily)
MKPIKKKDAIVIAGSAAKLARCLGVSRSAVTQWGEWMPPYRAMQLREKMPEQYDQHCNEEKKPV